MSALVSFDRVFEVLDLRADDPRGARRRAACRPTTGRSSSTHVSFSYPSAADVSLPSLEEVSLPEHGGPVDVLHDVSFRVEPGQLVALVGHSGAGKTTIAQPGAAALRRAPAGAVRVGGVDVRRRHAASRCATRSAWSARTRTCSTTSIRANLLYARPGGHRGRALGGAGAAPGSPTWSRSLPEGLDTVVGDRGYRLSGGEKQRLAIARVLLKAPGIVILDEATAHLDSESEVAVQHALDTALAGRTSLVIAHRLSTIRDADQILVVDGGRVVESGTHERVAGARGAVRRPLPHPVRRRRASNGPGRLTTSVTPVPVLVEET